MLINDALKEFIFDCEIRKISPRTLKSYRNNNLRFFNYVKQEFNIIELEEFSHLHIKKYFRFLIDKGLTETYANGILKCMRAFFVYCINEEYVIVNPCLKVSWQRVPKTLINTFTDLEIINMVDAFDYLNYLNARNKTIIAFLVDTGARNAETCGVLNNNIKDNFVLIKGKGNKERQVGLSSELKKIMMKYNRIKDYYFKDKVINHENYFLSNTGLPLTVETIEGVVKTAGEIAGVRKEIRCSPHTIRHYFAQKQLRNKLDIYSLSRILGHENVMITKIYLQSIKDEEIVNMSIKTSPLTSVRGGKKLIKGNYSGGVFLYM
ncbi:tyrosine-type recombinase/integrase [Clostridium estertheticum]|uniref:Tyrosine-type recombinase/integrase n=1 Tax=Clostridium estertheticum TaxID=238834 RepID=A0AA47EKA5_9CLOT|nr:tyrosine-type recombinase/integrase [Clostridium estertheticum]MBU3154772.1 tyrosine-type recombinase/integrase [Clostridium estertheticum]WAG61650.1 tyrosine-type recombinase/integrase [Clostridium estertheticum]